jgi:LPS export ABC transporter protein LptC
MYLMRSTTLPLVLLFLLVGAGACGGRNRAEERLAEDSAAAQDISGNLTLSNITLEQADEQGRTLWQVKAVEATYSPDQKTAEVTSPDGELYQDGKPVFRVQADRGEVEQNGNRIHLTGNIVATDIRSGAVLRGNELEWQPKQDLLIVRNNLTGTHPQIRASATEARVFSRQRRMELSGRVIALTTDPNLRMEAEHVIWEIDKQMVLSDRPAQVQRLQGRQVIGQARGDKAEINLQAKTVTLTQNGQLTLQDPPIQVASNSMTWNLKDETLNANQPVTVQHRQQRVTVTADRGRMNLREKMIYMTQNVHAVGQRNRSQLDTDSLTWNVDSQQINAEGNVFYSQADPPMNLRGARAVGKLQDQTIVVSGGRVVTQIVPE